ncbi:MAG TPA: hypothetical protein VEY08_14730, partial [Chloroflexia bacterium]|nr:hypothetical protein [Chloroflexia bacterium]
VKANPLSWLDFSPRPLADSLRVVPRHDDSGATQTQVLPFGCSDGRQALVWLLRDTRFAEGQAASGPIDLLLPGMVAGGYIIEFWETYEGHKVGEARVAMGIGDYTLRLALPDFGRDLAIAVRLEA